MNWGLLFMKTFLFALILIPVFLLVPSVALAQTGDCVNLSIQLLDQNTASDSVTCVSLQSFATGEITEQILDAAQLATFKDFPVQQFSIKPQNNSAQNAPNLNVSLYRGSKTEILHTDQNTAEIAVSADAKQLGMALVLKDGYLQVYAVTDKNAKAFSSLPASKSLGSASQPGIKFYFQDTWGTSLNSLALKMDAGDLHPSNLDGQIYIESVSEGTHKLIVSSKGGAKLGESHITVARQGETGLTASNEANPMISLDSNQQIVYVLADIQDNLIRIKQVSADPLTPGARPELSTVSLTGCLLDSAQKPIPQVKLSLGDYASTTDDSGVFEINKIPLDQYQMVAKDANGKKISALTLLMQKDFETGIKEVTLNSASVAIGPSATNLFVTLQLMDDRALMLRSVSDKQLALPAPSTTASPAAQPATDGVAQAGAGSRLAIYAYLLIAVVALIVVVLIVLFRLRRAARPKH